MSRPEMADVFARLRSLIGDTAGVQVFTDDELQDALDEHRTIARYEPLTPEGVYASGAMGYTIHHATYGEWEDSVVLTDGAYGAVTISTSDLHIGLFVISSTCPAVYASGVYFDLHAAAADVLDAWAARLALEFDFSADGSSFSRSQQTAMLREAATAHRGLARPVTRHLVDSDTATAMTPRASATFDVD